MGCEMSKEIDYAVLVEQLTIRNSCLRFQIEHLQEQKQKVIALIKDGRFIEALNVLDPKGEK